MLLPNTPAVIPNATHHNETYLYQSTIEQCWDNFQSCTTTIKANESWGDPINVKCDFQKVKSLGLSQNPSINWRFLNL
jgi:hypothetical protein